jgi:hypothetical protein
MPDADPLTNSLNANLALYEALGVALPVLLANGANAEMLVVAGHLETASHYMHMAAGNRVRLQ